MTYFIENPKAIIDIDLESQTVKVEENGFNTTFEIAPFKKKCFMEGVDEIQYLIGMKEEIAAFELNNY